MGDYSEGGCGEESTEPESMAGMGARGKKHEGVKSTKFTKHAKERKSRGVLEEDREIGGGWGGRGLGKIGNFCRYVGKRADRRR
jgi:hypothetical protein